MHPSLLYWVLSTTPLRLALRGSPRISLRIRAYLILMTCSTLNLYEPGLLPPLNRTHNAYSPFREVRVDPLDCMRLSAWVPQRGHPESPIGSCKQGCWVTTADLVDSRCTTHCGSQQSWTFKWPVEFNGPRR